MNNEKGISTLGGLLIIIAFLMFLPVLTSIMNIYTTYRDLNQIASVTTGIAKKNGGFNYEVMNVYYDLLAEYNIDTSKLDTVFYPGVNIKVNKREALGMELKHDMKFSIVQLDKSALSYEFVLLVRQSTYSQRFFRPSEL
ncbi:DUF4320 family protein [Alkaliphilus transvaalensis]|uniref:DUF4320 family protein n=1 Tax=Alkaliphilus transvaalensis TaxID=114628 RepID=UPI00047AF889|nr:DUF4320 family protein [Alkaliphilus transvaalensis]